MTALLYTIDPQDKVTLIKELSIKVKEYPRAICYDGNVYLQKDKGDGLSSYWYIYCHFAKEEEVCPGASFR